MLPRHGGVPNFSLRFNRPLLILLILVLITGALLALSLNRTVDSGDVSGAARVRLCVIATLLFSVLIVIAGTSRWWHPHLRDNGNSQLQHRRRHGKRRRHSHRHH